MKTDIELDRGVNRSVLRAASVVPLFALALFTSAALLFWVQPLIAKMLLPLLGGAPSVWNTCMVFFQVLLLAGYAYALLISQRFSLRNQAIIHALLLLAAALVLPFALSNRVLASLQTQPNPIIWLLSTLLVTAGPPFLLLSATAPLLQRWFSQTNHRSARDPYFLYAVSNAGSMLVLLAFPFALEPAFAVRTQSVIWAIGYVGLILLMVVCAILLNGIKAVTTPADTVVDNAGKTVGAAKRLEWTILALVPSSLMLGVTNYIAIDVASVPLIWIIPLAIYLSTFILAFGKKQIINPSIASILFPVALVCLGVFTVLNPPVSVWVMIGLHLLVFFLAALVCHQRLAQIRPHISKLAEYYLWIAVGGVLGGAFNALLAPLIFPMPFEYPLAIVLACLMRPPTDEEKRSGKWFLIIFPLTLFLVTLGLSLFAPRLGLPLRYVAVIVLLVPFGACFVISIQRPIAFGLGLAALMLGALPHFNSSDEILSSERNFFGIWRVTANRKIGFRLLTHGSTTHGVQLDDESRKCEATSYYHRDGPIGQVFEVYNAKSTNLPVAVTGLGSGTLGTYSVEGQQWDFYDIDPAIVRIASEPRLFTFLSDCTRGSYRVILGDARLKFREAPQGYYGVIVMDAFSSDSVPTHLLTSQALDLYLTKLAPDGVLAFHISNRYLNLEPLLGGLARHTGLSAFIRRDAGGNIPWKYSSTWVVMARNDVALGVIASDSRWGKLQGNVVWTDDFSNILGVLK
ncbi:MAG TPA: fused MFS/spermidine synthase [Pyrinomonadaceae bacterium]|nr:fused MFS/spermidine synthase [Pyrinomonadaceae bacterium]